MKRNSCPNTDSLNLEATHTHGIGINKKRYKSSSSSNGTGVIASCSLKKGLENETPQESITSYDLSLNKIKKSICRFFYENGLDLKAVPSFQRMMSHFLGQKIMQETIPTCHELKGWIFKDAMKDMRHYVDGIRKSWPQTGCSILLDGWMDGTSRHLVNILVDCPRGTVYLGSAEITDCFSKIDAMQLFLDKVIQEVGIDNVVQIITYSTSAFMKGVGKQLMEAYRPIFWTVSASACIELMLEKLESMDLIKETLNKAKIITRFVHSHPVAGLDLIKPSKIRSTQPFLTLENIVLEKQVLKTVFLSSDSNSSIISTVEGKRVADLMRDSLFWSRALTVSKATIPLVRVMEWMNESCNKEQVAYIYETIDQAKDTIKEGFKHKKSQYVQFWKVVDDVWNELLYSPLHSAGYFLNPNLFYSSDVFIDPEVATGLLCCIVRSTKDVHVQDRITIQMELYRMAKGAFGVGCAVDQRSDISPGSNITVFIS